MHSWSQIPQLFFFKETSDTTDIPRNFIVGSSNKQSSVYMPGVKSPAMLEELVIISFHISLNNPYHALFACIKICNFIRFNQFCNLSAAMIIQANPW